MTTGHEGIEVRDTGIDGLLELKLPVHRDSRGWFKENWQREKMIAAGLPDFKPVQNNVSFNTSIGTTRGLHAEPWDKYITVLSGRVFGAWVDLRPGKDFGKSYSTEVGPEQALFIPRGVANGFQTLEDGTVYSYLVTEHWSEHSKAEYSYVNLADTSLAIAWPIDLDQAIISDADREHPALSVAMPVQPKKIAVLGSNGQLGRALQELLAEDDRAVFYDRTGFDLSDATSWSRIPWRSFSHVINAAAMTDVDVAETPLGRSAAWRTNAVAVAELASICARYGIKLIHISTDYVFDGVDEYVDENHQPAPLNVYGQSKTAGEVAALSFESHTVIRASWVIGDGKNFVSTMIKLAQAGKSPRVVDDQYGRLTFSDDLASSIMHLIDSAQRPGIYHVQSTGELQSWYQLACKIFEKTGRQASDVIPVSSEEYFKHVLYSAPRPRNSSFSLRKIQATGYSPTDQHQALERYIDRAVLRQETAVHANK